LEFGTHQDGHVQSSKNINGNTYGSFVKEVLTSTVEVESTTY